MPEQTPLETLAPSDNVKALSVAAIARVNASLEDMARVAFLLHPEIDPADGWRYDAGAQLFVKLPLTDAVADIAAEPQE